MKLPLILALAAIILVSGCVSAPWRYSTQPGESVSGEFRGFLTVPVTLEDGEGVLRIGDREYVISGGNVIAGGSGQDMSNFTLEGIQFTLEESTDEKMVFRALVYANEDVVRVYTDPQHSGVIPSEDGYRFYFALLVTEEAGQRFADLTENMPKTFDIYSGEEYLDSSVLLYLDGEEISSLRIAAGLAGQPVTTPSIQGMRETKGEAFDEMRRLQAALS